MKDLANFIIGVVCLPLNVFTIFIASYLLHADYSRRRPMLVASGERQKLLNPTMAIFLYYHAVASAIDFVCIPMYMAMNLELPGGNETYMFARLREFLCNLYIFLPPIVGGFVILGKTRECLNTIANPGSTLRSRITLFAWILLCIVAISFPRSTIRHGEESSKATETGRCGASDSYNLSRIGGTRTGTRHSCFNSHSKHVGLDHLVLDLVIELFSFLWAMFVPPSP